MKPLIPTDCFWLIIDENFRVARVEKLTDFGAYLTLFQNDEKAWSNDPLITGFVYECDEDEQYTLPTPKPLHN